MLVYQRVAQTSSGKLKQPGDVSWLSWEFQELVPLWFSETPFIKAVLWKMIQRHTRPCRCWIWRWQLTEQGWEVLSCSIWFTHGIVWKGSPKSTDSWSCSLLFHIQIAVLFFFPSSSLRLFEIAGISAIQSLVMATKLEVLNSSTYRRSRASK